MLLLLAMFLITNPGPTTSEVEVCLLIFVVKSSEDFPEVFDLLILGRAIEVDCLLFEQLDVVRLELVGLGKLHDIMPVQVASEVVQFAERVLDATLHVFDLLSRLTDQLLKKCLTELSVVFASDQGGSFYSIVATNGYGLVICISP